MKVIDVIAKYIWNQLLKQLFSFLVALINIILFHKYMQALWWFYQSVANGHTSTLMYDMVAQADRIRTL